MLCYVQYVLVCLSSQTYTEDYFCKMSIVKKKVFECFHEVQGHHFDIKNHDDTTVSRHFNRCPSSQPAGFDGIRISIPSFIKNPSNSKAGQIGRDREEKRWIHGLATVVPKGLNLID